MFYIDICLSECKWPVMWVETKKRLLFIKYGRKKRAIWMMHTWLKRIGCVCACYVKTDLCIFKMCSQFTLFTVCVCTYIYAHICIWVQRRNSGKQFADEAEKIYLHVELLELFKWQTRKVLFGLSHIEKNKLRKFLCVH